MIVTRTPAYCKIWILIPHIVENLKKPGNQHGLWVKRSTMNAWAKIQIEWAQNSEEKFITGVLLWDLSAAFETLDADFLMASNGLVASPPKLPSYLSTTIIIRFISFLNSKALISKNYNSLRYQLICRQSPIFLSVTKIIF